MKYIHEQLDIVFSLHRKNWILMDSMAAVLGGFLYWLTGKIDMYIWSPPTHYYTLLALLASDFITGSMYAWKMNKYETRRAMRVVYKLLSYTVVLTLAFQFSKHNDMLSWLPGVIFVPMVVILMTSLIVNMSLLGWMDKRIAMWLTKKIDLYKQGESEEDRKKDEKRFQEIQEQQLDNILDKEPPKEEQQ